MSISVTHDLTVKQLHEVVGGRLRLATLEPRDGECTRIEQLSIDTREIAAGETFWGLSGSNFDGSAFAEHAYQRGATGAVVSGRYVQPPPGCWNLEVTDTSEALTRLAEWNRNRFRGTAVAVTGSVGKTSARNMIEAVLGTTLGGSASAKNYNNHLGLPLSLLQIEPTHDFAVLELAASREGEIASLSQLCRAEVGVITRIADAHLGSFGSKDAIRRAKTELLAALPAGGWAVLPGDDSQLRRAAKSCRANTLWFGRDVDCDVAASSIESRGGRLSFRVEGQHYEVPVWGRHYLAGALAAIAVGRIFGLTAAEIARGLAGYRAVEMRCEVTPGNITIINDAYNASPAATRAALELLRDFDAPGRRVVVCGDMAELGSEAGALHARLGGEVVTLCGADLLVACGKHALDVVSGATAAGMPRTRAIAFANQESALPALEQQLEAGDIVLVKGSRAMAMERLVAMLDQSVVGLAA